MEGNDVATDDITREFLQNKYERGDIHTNMERAIVTLLEEIYPAYYKDFIYMGSCGRNCMYAEAKKATYVTLESLMLFWTKLSNIL